MIQGTLALLPWLALGAFLVWGIRMPPRLPVAGPEAPEGELGVTVVVPARNEARNIERCLTSLARQDHSGFEVVVVDDRSEDGTGDRARAVPPGRARRIRVLEGRTLPEGWLGKPWACHQGAEAAQGEWLLFTDADTWHGPDLLSGSLAAAREAGVNAVTVTGHQEVRSFWERLVQPQVLSLLALRYPRTGPPLPPDQWREAIANGQYILIRRSSYRALGGHERVKGEVAEDLRLAQELTRTGDPLVVRYAPDSLSTRMYRSLPELVEGWSKNMAVGGAQSVGRLWQPWVIPGILAYLLTFWVVPPGVLLVHGLLGAGHAGVLLWSAGATLTGALLWSGASWRFGVSPGYGLLYPLGALVVAWIALRSGIRGRRRVEWKGRSYRVHDHDTPSDP